MEKEFVPYTEALELKELGFDEGCFAYYTDGEYTLDKNGNKTNFVLLSAKLRGELTGHGTVQNNLFKWLKDNDRTSGELYVLSNSTTAPTFSQAFRWFREKYGLVIQYIPFELDNEEGQSILHHKHKISEYDSWRGGRRNTIETELCDGYEEAELACLKKLIEIIKNK